MRLLLLEDDDILGEAVRDYLRAEGHVVDWFTRLDAARMHEDEPFDLLLLDWQLPDGTGVAWLRKRRTAGDRTPVILLTARDQLADRVAGLDAGADDYLVKPFALEELAARVRAQARRGAAAGASRVRAGEVEVDVSARGAWRAGARVELTAREWAVLEALALRAGRVVTKADLERLVLGADADVASNALEVHVSALRRKLGRELIETVRGLGYRLGDGPEGAP
jgi:two-component system OmpR family response regulator